MSFITATMIFAPTSFFLSQCLHLTFLTWLQHSSPASCRLVTWASPAMPWTRPLWHWNPSVALTVSSPWQTSQRAARRAMKPLGTLTAMACMSSPRTFTTETGGTAGSPKRSTLSWGKRQQTLSASGGWCAIHSERLWTASTSDEGLWSPFWSIPWAWGSSTMSRSVNVCFSLLC